MRLLLVLLILLIAFLSNSSFGQFEDTTTPVEEDFKLIIPNTICLDNNIPFVSLPKNSQDFEFSLYNRWGELLICTNNPKFELGILLEKNRKDFFYMEQLICVIKYKNANGEEIVLQAPLTYIEYCNCG